MTGSFWAPIVIPVVVVIALAAWLVMVYYADAHPGWKAHGAASHPGSTGMTAADARKQIMQPEVTSVAIRGANAAKPDDHDGGVREPSLPSRRVA
jgi:hypothetical protein